MLKLYKSGVSLIVLVITIIVIIILSGAVLLSLAINNPIGQAVKATFLNDVSAFQSELNTYTSSQYANTLGSFDPTRLQADENSLTYMGTVDTSKTINDIIPSLNQNEKYADSFEIINGRLAYSGIDTSQQEWAREQRLPVLATDYPYVTIIPTGNMIASSGTDVIYSIEITSAAEITTVNLEGKIEVLDGSGTPLSVQPTIIFDQLSGTSTDIIRQIKVTIKTDTLSEGSYLLRLRHGAIGNSLNLANPKDIIDLSGFTIDNEAPMNPIITPSILTWTNNSVDVAIQYSEDTVTMQYSLDSITWNTYDGSITVIDNNTTIYARGLDNAGNESGISTITIANIDKEAPTLDVTDGGTTSSSVRVEAIAVDTGGSGINTGSYQYSKDDGVTWTDITSSTSYTFDNLVAGEYGCRVKVSDNAGNSVVNKTNAFTFALDWNASKGVNKPKLAPGMTPIKWSGSTVVTTTESDTGWYDYPNKVWANARTVDGSMWVWLPRYEYRIPTPHSSSPQTIQINFKQNLTTTATSGFRVHPAFTFGSTQLTGIWIAKFEAGGTASAVDVKPGVTSLRSLNMSDMFTATRNMETNSRYGWGTSGSGFDTHFIKNIEWGAAAYLGHSTYGRVARITPNTSGSYITGGGSGTTYISSGLQSTTGNVYGIYDMCGGNWEFVVALPSNNNYNITTNASVLMNADVKYRDMYIASPDSQASNYANAATKYGDAIYETSTSYQGETTWYGGYSYMIYTDQITFVRGGVAMGATYSNQFASNVYAGAASSVHGFRPALAVASGL